LTAREREVMQQVISGLLNKQVAAELNITEFTVKIHRGQVMRKMHADSLADLVRMAESLGIRSHKRKPEHGIDNAVRSEYRFVPTVLNTHI
jgi:Response regulator